MSSTGPLARARQWAARVLRSGPEQSPSPAEQGEPIESLRAKAATAVIGIDDAIRASQEELDLAGRQVDADAHARFTAALNSARELADEAFTHHDRAAGLARGEAAGGHEERAALARVLYATHRADRALDAETEELARLRDLRDRVPTMLGELAAWADEIEADIPAAEALLEELLDEHGEVALATIAGSMSRAGRLVRAGRELIASGRSHLEDEDDRAASVVAARAAEDALGQARDEVRAVEQARERLADADEDVRQALNSIHADLRDVRRHRATDPRTTAAVERAMPVIDAASSARRTGGDLLAALADLEAAEEDIDTALAEYREGAEQSGRERVRLERRVRNTANFITGVDRRMDRSRGYIEARARSQLARAYRLLARAETLVATDPAAAGAELTVAMSAAKEAQHDVDRAAMEFAAGDYEAHGDGVVTGESVAALALAGILAAAGGGSRGGGWGGSSGGFGGGGRF